jgi:hypothetical protein
MSAIFTISIASSLTLTVELAKLVLSAVTGVRIRPTIKRR